MKTEMQTSIEADSSSLAVEDLQAALPGGVPVVAPIPCGSCKKPWRCEQRGCMDKARSEPAPTVPGADGGQQG